MSRKLLAKFTSSTRTRAINYKEHIHTHTKGYLLSLFKVDNYLEDAPLSISMKLCSFDAFLHETKESGRKICLVSQSEILTLIGYLWSFVTCTFL